VLSTSAVTLPGGTLAVQLPFAPEVTLRTPPVLSVTVTVTLERLGSLPSCVP
jgi:hypothetical protein